MCEKGRFFVMLNTQSGGFIPLMRCTNIATNEAEFATFDNHDDAREGALESVLGEKFGFEVFEMGAGKKMIKSLLDIIEAQKEYIDALPDEVVAKLPAMPGFDHDWADEVIYAAKQTLKL